MISAMLKLPIAVVAVAALAAPAGTARAQTPDLTTVESAITAGDYEAARGTLDRWWAAADRADVAGADRARALMLRARLAPDPAAAEPDYLALVLGYPTSDHTPDALLRLGQGLLARGEVSRAIAYLERLVADYPGRPQRLPALLWLARAHNATRRADAACEAANTALQDVRDPDLAAMLRIEAAASCAVRTTTLAPADAAARGDWAVQIGAFRYRDGADALRERLRDAGFSPRIVRVPRNDLFRVRVGRFATSADAEALITRLRDRGFDAVVVRDAAQERSP